MTSQQHMTMLQSYPNLLTPTLPPIGGYPQMLSPPFNYLLRPPGVGVGSGSGSSRSGSQHNTTQHTLSHVDKAHITLSFH